MSFQLFSAAARRRPRRGAQPPAGGGSFTERPDGPGTLARVADGAPVYPLSTDPIKLTACRWPWMADEFGNGDPIHGSLGRALTLPPNTGTNWLVVDVEAEYGGNLQTAYDTVRQDTTDSRNVVLLCADQQTKPAGYDWVMAENYRPGGDNEGWIWFTTPADWAGTAVYKRGHYGANTADDRVVLGDIPGPDNRLHLWKCGAANNLTQFSVKRKEGSGGNNASIRKQWVSMFEATPHTDGGIYFVASLGYVSVEANTPADWINQIVLERFWIHGHSSGAGNSNKGLAIAQAQHIGVYDFRIDDIHWTGFADCNAIWLPYETRHLSFWNFHIWSIGECVLHGGVGPYNRTQPEMQSQLHSFRRGTIAIPFDRNSFHSTSNGVVRYMKNLFESKNGSDCLVEAVVLRHAWAGGQVGDAILYQNLSDNNDYWQYNDCGRMYHRHCVVTDTLNGSIFISKIWYHTNQFRTLCMQTVDTSGDPAHGGATIFSINENGGVLHPNHVQDGDRIWLYPRGQANVNAVDGNTITLNTVSGTPYAQDGTLVNRYATFAGGTPRLITAHVGNDITVDDATGIAVGNRVRTWADAAGTDVLALGLSGWPEMRSSQYDCQDQQLRTAGRYTVTATSATTFVLKDDNGNPLILTGTYQPSDPSNRVGRIYINAAPRITSGDHGLDNVLFDRIGDRSFMNSGGTNIRGMVFRFGNDTHRYVISKATARQGGVRYLGMFGSDGFSNSSEWATRDSVLVLADPNHPYTTVTPALIGKSGANSAGEEVFDEAFGAGPSDATWRLQNVTITNWQDATVATGTDPQDEGLAYVAYGSASIFADDNDMTLPDGSPHAGRGVDHAKLDSYFAGWDWRALAGIDGVSYTGGA